VGACGYEQLPFAKIVTELCTDLTRRTDRVRRLEIRIFIQGTSLLPELKML